MVPLTVGHDVGDLADARQRARRVEEAHGTDAVVIGDDEVGADAIVGLVVEADQAVAAGVERRSDGHHAERSAVHLVRDAEAVEVGGCGGVVSGQGHWARVPRCPRERPGLEIVVDQVGRRARHHRRGRRLLAVAGRTERPVAGAAHDVARVVADGGQIHLQRMVLGRLNARGREVEADGLGDGVEPERRAGLREVLP
jgi:hypothetical protein